MVRRLGALMLAAALGAFSFELLVRVFQPQMLPRDSPGLWRPDPEIGWRHVPEIRMRVNHGERDVDVCTDQTGDRVRCPPAGRPLCRRRVLVTGDSYVEALSVPFEDTVWAKLEASTGACFEVAGVSAYGPAQYGVVVRERLDRVRYDLVLYHFYAGNDFTEDPQSIPPPTNVGQRPVRWRPRSWSAEDLRHWLSPCDDALAKRSHGYVALRFLFLRALDPGDVGEFGIPLAVRTSLLDERVLARSASAVARAARHSARRGAGFVVVVIPHRSQVLDPAGETLTTALPALAGDIDMDLVSRLFVPQLRRIPEVDAVVDLLPPFRAHADADAWGARDQHFSPEGHRIWFDALRAPVESALSSPRLRVPPKPAPDARGGLTPVLPDHLAECGLRSRSVGAARRCS